MSKKFVIITSINAPTKATKDYANINDCQLILVGDKKTPDNWELKNCKYLSVENQEKCSYNIIKKLPFNHYSRKMIGYLEAMQLNANIIIDTDDDNIPKENWGFPEFSGEFKLSEENLGFINIYKEYSDLNIWPRGFPLNLILEKKEKPQFNKSENLNIGIWQGLADGDPDVDAIYRLTNNTPCFFQNNEPVVLNKGVICPSNSQNTAFKKEFFPLLYLPAFVTFRFTDILRGLVAQPILWQYNHYMGFTEATVLQERNYHDYMKDFEQEIPCFLHSEKVIDIVRKSIKNNLSISDNLFNSYNALLNANIVSEKELVLLEAWLKDIDSVNNTN